MNTPSEGFEAVSCPKCESPLVQGNAPFYLHGEYIGSFQSLICEICHYSALTESGYRNATRIAEQLALIGPASELPNERSETWYETEQPITNQFAIEKASLDIRNLIIVKSEEKAKGTSFTIEAQILQKEYNIQYNSQSRAKYEIPPVSAEN